MFRKLTACDHDRVMPFLTRRPSQNLFLLGDIEAHGYDAPFQEVWGYIDDQGDVHTMLLRYFGSYIYSTETGEGSEEVVRILAANTAWTLLQGDSLSLATFRKAVGYIPSRTREFHFAERKPGAPRPSIDTSLVQEATLDHVDALLQLRRTIVEFADSTTTRESLRQSIQSRTGLYYFVPGEAGELASSASTVAENSLSAMVVGVCTRPLYRGQGYATQCLAKICETYDQRGKGLCLFYDNPKAGRIYQRLGFEEIGGWTQFYR